MARRFGSSYSLRMLLGALAGTAVGAALASAGQNSAFALFRDALGTLSATALALGQMLAFPLLIGAIISGSDGLEPMRGAGRLAGKAALWIAGASTAAVLVGAAVGLLTPLGNREFPEVEPPNATHEVFDPQATSLWLAFAAVAIGLGIYRNQIEESRSRLLVRFATALRETCTLAFAGARPWLPALVFLVAAAQAPAQGEPWTNIQAPLLALAAGWAVYGLAVLPAALWLGARISPARYAAAVAPAIFAALAAAGSSRAILPITFDAVCRRGGVSNRVAGTVLSMCAALQRDGQALGLTLAQLLVWRSLGLHPGIGLVALAALGGWLAGCGLRSAWLLTLGIAHGALSAKIWLPLVAFETLIGGLGNAVTLFSHTCAAAVIARSEGEKAFLPAQPEDDSALLLDDSLP